MWGMGRRVWGGHDELSVVTTYDAGNKTLTLEVAPPPCSPDLQNKTATKPRANLIYPDATQYRRLNYPAFRPLPYKVLHESRQRGSKIDFDTA